MCRMTDAIFEDTSSLCASGLEDVVDLVLKLALELEWIILDYS